MIDRYELSEEQFDRIFDQEIRPTYFANRQAEERPTAVLVGGQPAAGKTQAIMGIKREHEPANLVEIVGDDFRLYHPEYRQLMQSNPLGMPDCTAQAAGEWVRRSIDHARRNRISIVVEGTFRTPDTTVGTAQSLAEAGFDTHIVALAVPGYVSRLDAVHRYQVAVSNGQPARWTPPLAHEAGYVGTPNTVAAAEECRSVHRVSVVDRAGHVLYENARIAGGEWEHATGAEAAIRAARAKPPSRREAAEWIERLHQNVDWSVEHNLPSKARIALVRLANNDAPLVLAYAHPHEEQSRASALDKLSSARQRLQGYLPSPESHHLRSDTTKNQPEVDEPDVNI